MSNTAPSTSNNSGTCDEDFAYVLSTSDFHFVDVDNDTLQAIVITSTPTVGMLRLKGVSVVLGQTISVADISAGYLVFTPAADASGSNYDSFDFKVSDGIDISADAATFSLNVNSRNEAPSFSVGTGKQSIFFGQGADFAKSVVTQSDGKIVLGGYSYQQGQNDFAVARLGIDGNLDTSFGNGGVSLVNFAGYEDIGYSLSIQADGRILIGGVSSDGNKNMFALARFTDNGTLDSSFGIGGKLTTDFEATHSYGYSVAIQADGKILLAGSRDLDGENDFALARYLSDGTLDENFGTAGKLTSDLFNSGDVGTSLLFQANGKIILAGKSFDGNKNNFALVRYDNDGNLDDNFSGDGKLFTDFVSNNDFGNAIVIQADGKIIVAGTSESNSTSGDFALARYLDDGSLDPDFGTNGILTTDFANSNDTGNSIAMQADGKIVVGGFSEAEGAPRFALARYLTNGNLDVSFGNAGTLTTSFENSVDFGWSLTIQADGKILLSGSTDNGSWVGFGIARYNIDGSLDNTFATTNTLDAAPTFIAKGNPVVLDNNVIITDAELKEENNYNGSSLSLSRKGAPNAQDLFAGSGSLALNDGSVKINSTTVGTYTNNAGSLAINFNNYATQSLVNAVAQQITYANSVSSANGNIQIEWRFNDGSGSDNAVITGSTSVTLQPAEVNILGKTNVGQSLSVLSYINDPDGNGPFKYQWLANDVSIRGANSSTYKLSTADLGKTIKVTVSHVDGMGNLNSFTSDPTIAITDLNNKPTGTVKISGTAIQGGILSVSHLTLADMDGFGEDGISYQWKANGINIDDDNEDDSTFVLSQAQVGKKITVEAVYIDNQGNAEKVSSLATLAVGNVNDNPTGSIVISDTSPHVGQVLTITSTIGDLDGLPTSIRYQWTADGLTIRGATSTSYTVRSTDLGKEIKVIATYTDLLGKLERVESNPTEDVTQNVPPIAPVSPPPSGFSSMGSLLWAGQLLASSSSGSSSASEHGHQYQDSVVDMIGIANSGYDFF